MKTVVTTYQDSARVVLIHKAAELEVKVLHDTVVQRFVSLLTHICSTSLLAKSADPSDYKVHFLLCMLNERRNASKELCTRDEFSKVLASRFPTQDPRVLDRGWINNPASLADCTSLIEETNPPGEILLKIQRFVHTPMEQYFVSVAYQSSKQKLGAYFTEQTVTKATETASMQIDSNIELRSETLQSLIDTALLKQSKEFERKHKSLENTVKQISA
ncbi:hypothetical protein MHU86_22674 [Fragilaria crotonensis]|nr:hypothetical protein MHU86_22674 [Fragilaria crotonensis]